MRVRWLGIAMCVVVLALTPSGASGHDDVALQSEAQHVAEDAVSPHTPAMEARLAQRTRKATLSDVQAAQAAMVGNAHDVGSWGPLTDFPLVPVHVALLPNGKVLAYDNVGDGAAESYTDHTFSRATVWDPVTGSQLPVWVNTGYNIFCSGLAHLPDGTLFVAGGNKNAQLEGIVQTHVFNYLTNTWSLGPDMAAERWYPTVTPLRTGEMMISDTVPELRTTGGFLRSLHVVQSLPLYPWMDAAPDGRTFISGPEPTMRMLDTSQGGTWQTFGQRDSLTRDYGSHALYDIGKILVAGGANSSKDARVIDLNGSAPQVTPTSPMANGRRQHNLTVLADGTVLATGGNSSGADKFDLANGVYVAEQWDPATGNWKTLAPESATRQYHSTALLLPDGRVLSAGGGVCAGCDVGGYLNKNGQVFSPPYLFNPDGSLASRPTIAGAPAAVTYGADFAIDTPDAAAIRKVALVRLGAVTHSVNMEQRYVPLTFTAAAGTVTATAPANPNIAPPGVYMLFILDANGVPSVAKMVSVGAAPAGTSDPTATTNLTATPAGANRVDLGWTAAGDDVGVTGYRVERCQGTGCTDFSVVASVIGTVYGDAGRSASTTYRYRVRAVDSAGNLGAYSNVVETTTGSGQSAPPGLVGAWAFGEGVGSTTADASGNGNSGTINGAAWTQGRFGNALDFNGTSNTVRIPSATSLNLGSAMTLSAWVQPTVTQDGWDTIVFRQSDNYFLTASGNVEMRPAGGITLVGSETTIESPTAIPVGTWTHLALTYDGSILRLYVNGTQVATHDAGGAIANTTNPLWIGGNQPFGNYFEGAIDEVRVYNRTLTQAEIQSDMTTPILPSPPDSTPPPAPSGLSAAPMSASQINVSWSASPDDVGVVGYRVERCQGAGCTNFTQVASPAWIGLNDTGLGSSGTYRYRVRAVDQAGNVGPYSAIATATTLGGADTTAPSAPTGLTPTVVSSTQIDLAWTASTDNVGVTGYRVERCAGASCTNFTQVGTPSATSFSNTGLTASTTYRFRVRAVDAAGNLSAYSAIVAATTSSGADTTPPSAPTGVTPTVVSSTQIDLAWTASTDNVGVTGYFVERCAGASCTNFAQVGTPSSTSFSNTGLTAGTTYRFRVRSGDAAGNLSAYSGIVTAATPAVADTTPPSAPTGLSATAVGSGQVDLGWTAATDDVAVAGYRVERCTGSACTDFAQVATPTATSYSDAGLAASTTYRYRVRAADSAGNLGPYSAVAEATTAAAPPVPPGLVGGWSFSEGAGSTTADASGNGNTGTITGASWSTQGRFGNALSFDGKSSVVRVPSAASLNVTTAVTLSGWVRPTANQSGWRTIVQRQADAYFLTAGSSSARRPAGGGTFGSTTVSVASPTALALNTWAHVAMTYDGASIRLYVNGTQVATRAATGTIQIVSNPLWIGGNQPYGEYFKGLIDEVRVYGRALTQTEIQTDMNAAVGLAGLASLRQPNLLL